MSTTKSKANQNQSVEYFLLEQRRREFADNLDYKKLKNTYKSRLFLKNKNTGSFWDKKFSSSYEKNLSNPMEKDRNNTAKQWFRDVLLENEETLNIGSGDGNFERLIASIDIPFSHTGSDIAVSSLNNLKNKYPRFNFIGLDVLKDKIPSSYSVICLFEVLEHIPPSEALNVLKKIRRSLKIGGYLLISVPMNEGLEKMYPYNPNEHLRCYSESLLSAELKMSNFSIIKTKVFFAFSKYYLIKSVLAKLFFKKRWVPNNILILAQKK